MFIGLVIFAVGVIFLMQNLGYITGSVWGIIWPSLVIIIGLMMILRPRMHNFRWSEFRKNKVGKK